MHEKIPYVLIIADGWGIGEKRDSNAVYMAKTPFLDGLMQKYPASELKCSGKDVGLPDGVMGNSEVGHMNIGSGRIAFQDLLRINMSIENKSFFENEVLKSAFKKASDAESAIHFIGLISDGGVHSHINHLFALIDMAILNKADNIFIHAIMDGRDTPPKSGACYITTCQNYIKDKNVKIASICGRYFAMDRDNRWERVEKAYRLYSNQIGVKEKDPLKAVLNAYEKGETDEFIKPVIITDEKNKPVAKIRKEDVIICFNFRSDRIREITAAVTKKDFTEFERKAPIYSNFVCFTEYDEKFAYLPIAFPPVIYKNTIGEVISRNGLNQIRIAETEKYAHVTYFFNAGEEKPFLNEERILIPSPKEVASYDQKPEMSAYKIAEEAVKRINSDKYDFIAINFANMDMVGHTGNLEAAIKACEIVDECVKLVVTEILGKNGSAIVTADHGNAEIMRFSDGSPCTSHSLNSVPFILVDNVRKNMKLKKGRLSDIAPTILDIMKIEKPSEMTGESLITVP